MRNLILGGLLLLAACNGGPTGQQGVFAAKTAFEAALTVAVAYSKLPRCSATQAAPCAQADVIKKADNAAQIAAMAIDGAERIVRTPSISPALADSQVALARAAVAELNAITNEMQETR